MQILVTGAAGFIGYHLVEVLLNYNHKVIGIDNLNEYYDPKLKQLRLDEIKKNKNSDNFNFIYGDIADKTFIDNIFSEHRFEIVINLAAQAGVRYSIDNPYVYHESNSLGFLNILEGSRNHKVNHLVFASSSSVYGMNIRQPFSTRDRADYPISLYAATKRSNELMAHTYSHLFRLPVTGLRFFTVYGPFGRPDMAYYKFTKSILTGEKIDVFNENEMKRDFTYIDDIIEGIISIIQAEPPKEVSNKISSSNAPFKIYNIGNNKPETLSDFIAAIEKACNKKAIKNHMPMQPGDVTATYADIDDLKKDFNFDPKVNIDEGIKRFVDWFKKFEL